MSFLFGLTNRHRYAFVPLLVLFESTPPSVVQPCDDNPAHDTALLIPCYKSETIIGPTLEAALKIFPASQIFVIANGNSETPLDNVSNNKSCARFCDYAFGSNVAEFQSPARFVS